MEAKPLSQLLLRLPDELILWMKKILHERHQEKSEEPFVDVVPDPEMPDNYTFKFNGTSYPALLENLPTVVEAHKTFDRKIFIKSGDIGQVLVVFNTDAERQAARDGRCKLTSGESVIKSGLTPPTVDITKARFEKSIISKVPPNATIDQIRRVCYDISPSTSAAAVAGPTAGLTPAKAPKQPRGKDKDKDKDKDKTKAEKAKRGEKSDNSFQVVHEEVVDFEDWMISAEQPTGLNIKVVGKDMSWIRDHRNQVIIQHPEILRIPSAFGSDAEVVPEAPKEQVLKLQLSRATIQSAAAVEASGLKENATTLSIPRIATSTSSLSLSSSSAAAAAGAVTGTAQPAATAATDQFIISMPDPEVAADGATSKIEDTKAHIAQLYGFDDDDDDDDDVEEDNNGEDNNPKDEDEEEDEEENDVEEAAPNGEMPEDDGDHMDVNIDDEEVDWTNEV